MQTPLPQLTVGAIVLALSPAAFAQSVLFEFNGVADFDGLGWGVDAAGDVNADGVPDVIAGAPYTESTPGVVTGSARVFSGANGQVLHEFFGDAHGDRFGWAVAGIGDVNDDDHCK